MTGAFDKAQQRKVAQTFTSIPWGRSPAVVMHFTSWPALLSCEGATPFSFSTLQGLALLKWCKIR